MHFTEFVVLVVHHEDKNEWERERERERESHLKVGDHTALTFAVWDRGHSIDINIHITHSTHSTFSTSGSLWSQLSRSICFCYVTCFRARIFAIAHAKSIGYSMCNDPHTRKEHTHRHTQDFIDGTTPSSASVMNTQAVSDKQSATVIAAVVVVAIDFLIAWQVAPARLAAHYRLNVKA